ncbi:MAG: hypothetical protein AAGA44_09365 [Pseudomonadota bacterium]
MKTKTLRLLALASAGVALLLVIQVGASYVKLRSLDHHLPLVVASVSPREGWVSGRMIEFELRRRISNGEFDGAMVLLDIASTASSDDLRDRAKQRAEWLIGGLVDAGATTASSLHHAIGGNDAAAVKFLLRLGADPNLKVGAEGESQMDAFEYAQFAQSAFPDREMLEVLEALNSPESAK